VPGRLPGRCRVPVPGGGCVSDESEAAFTTRVIETAQWYGWLAVHFRPARTEAGWRTAMQGDKGFPDLVLSRAGVVLICELKVGKNRPTVQQQAWGTAIGSQYRLWYPSDQQEILAELSAACTSKMPKDRSTQWS
jgi:hypothetical protein